MDDDTTAALQYAEELKDRQRMECEALEILERVSNGRTTDKDAQALRWFLSWGGIIHPDVIQADGRTNVRAT